MKTTTFYKAVILCLLLINTGTLAWLWVQQGRQQHMQRPDMRVDRLIMDRLHLNTQQQEQFEILKREHHSQMLEIQHQSAEMHNVLFGLLKETPADSAKREALIVALGDNDQKKERITFEHFRKLRAILDEKQKADFDALADELGRRLLSQQPHDGPPQDGPPPPP